MERTKYVDHLAFGFFDRIVEEPASVRVDYPAVDVVMLTLDAEAFLVRCLYHLYKEVPVNRLLVCDGGSKDSTEEIFEHFPRVQFFLRPDIRTTGKAFEFLFSHVQTTWCVVLDSDIELPQGWFSKIFRHGSDRELDVMECAERTLVYHFARAFPAAKLDTTRPYDFCHLATREAVQSFHCDDDYVWRMSDYYFRQEIEKAGYRYGKVPVNRFHHATEGQPYRSDQSKSFLKMECPEPNWTITDQAKYEAIMTDYAKGIVKYLDPAFPLVKFDTAFNDVILRLDRKWVEENGAAWLPIYDAEKAKVDSSRRRVRLFGQRVVRWLRKQL